MERDFVDLHLHYVPAVDDGVRSVEEGIALCQGLRTLGFERLVATPHIRTAMFDNRAPALRQAFEGFVVRTRAEPDMPALGLGAEHFCDDVFAGLFERGEALAYPGGTALLVEFPANRFPLAVEQQFFRMRVKGVTPVIAHPERYAANFRNSDALARLLELGALAQLDVMSLVGKYGRSAKRTAERLLREEAYAIACSDAHRPDDVPVVAEALDQLRRLVGERPAHKLLSDNPHRLLAGEAVHG